MQFRFLLLLVVLIAQCVFCQVAWEDEIEDPYSNSAYYNKFVVPILSDKRSFDQKIRSLKQRTNGDRVKQILFG
ncbi:unnamed protein product [Caenorhabditis bovis]|uniref:Uncharacterized protein n=1 Tax=Caenorhabditis bovis TaxID=2654633 RepID=A0A8S1EIC1_9PELO|nr:unnamed protein product [Caenorhabditis bovis]